jgi:hypothetical protein
MAVAGRVVAVTEGQVASVIAAGSVQVMVTGPVKPLLPVKPTDATPELPGVAIVTLAIDPIVKGIGVIVRAIVAVCVRLPEVPVTVTVVGPPTVAVLLAVSVKTLVVLVLVGLKDAVTPLGRVEVTVKATLPVKPFVGPTVIVLVPPAVTPCAMLKVPGAAASVKLGGGFTVSAIVVVWVRLPEVPVTVTVVGPLAVAEPLAVSVKTLVVPVLVGLKEAVTPVGRVEVTAKATLPEKPLAGFTVTVLVPPARVGVIVRLVGAADSVKFGGGVTVRAIVVVCVRLPKVPVMVTVVGPPTVAEPLAVSVKTLVVPVLVGLNDAVTPVGRVEVTANATLLVKPFAGFTVTVLVPLVPCPMLRVLGAAESVKSGGGVTVRAIIVVAVRLPDVPVTVTVVGPPVTAEPLAVSVKTLVVPVLVGLNEAVTPVGRVEVTAKLTLPEKPPEGVTVIVLVPLLPCAMLKVLGAAAIVKLGVVARLYSQMPRP